MEAQTLQGTLELGATQLGGVLSRAGPMPEAREIGRYVLVDLLGSGGMGAVYRAYDPELDRVVAIKLVLEGGSESHQLRLQREAQAIAKLSHPNVVQVFDVGRVSDGAVFIAMEYVAGMTLRAWLSQGERTTKEILAVFIQAGLGLAAAHECGLIHRDFKPENVLVDGEGRPRVVDFGLAKGASEIMGELVLERDLPPSLSASSLPFDSAITRDGAQLGTPAYMPPEQYAGTPVDVRSDVYSFGVALWEALYGQLPFAGSRAESYAVAVLDGARRSPPRDANVPRHILAVLERALSVAPGDRHPSMDSMLAQLRDDPVLRRRRRLLGTGVVAIALTLGVVSGAEPEVSAQVDVCLDAGTRIDRVWNPERHDAVEQALRAIDRPFALATATRTSDELDALAQDWSGLALEQCRRDPSEPLFHARAACLDDLHLRIDRLASALEQPSPTTLEHAVDAVAALSSVRDECRDLAALEARADRLASERDPLLAEVAELLVLADDALARGDIGAAGELEGRMPQPPAAGGWPTALVLDRARLGAELDVAEGDFEAASERLGDAAQLVVGGPPAPLAAAVFQAALAELNWELGDLDGLELGLARALRLTELAHGPDHPATHLARGETGHAPYARGEYPEAVAIYRAADEALATSVPDDDLDRLTVAGWIAEALDGMSRHAEAIAALELLHARYTIIYGATHPLTLDRLESLGRSRLRAGDHVGALVDLEDALAGLRADPDWRDALHEAVLLGNVGAALTAGERWDAAEKRLLEALERLPHAREQTATHRTALEANLALIRNSKGDHTGALEVLRACVERVDAQGSDASHNGLMIRIALAQTLLVLAKPEPALVRADEALARAKQAGSQVLVARSHLRRAQALDQLDRRKRADLALGEARAALEEEAGVETWVASIDAYERGRM